MKLEFYLLSLN